MKWLSFKNSDNSLASGDISTIFLITLREPLYLTRASSISDKYSTISNKLIFLNPRWIFLTKSMRSSSPITHVNRCPRMLSSVQS
ncbi:MAG: hypothetical protein ACTSRZ_17585 [Promethearchaeota archaeon]